MKRHARARALGALILGALAVVTAVSRPQADDTGRVYTVAQMHAAVDAAPDTPSRAGGWRGRIVRVRGVLLSEQRTSDVWFLLVGASGARLEVWSIPAAGARRPVNPLSAWLARLPVAGRLLPTPAPPRSYPIVGQPAVYRLRLTESYTCPACAHPAGVADAVLLDAGHPAADG